MKVENKAGLALLSVIVLVGLLHATGEMPDLRDPALTMASWDTTRFQPEMAQATQTAHEEVTGELNINSSGEVTLCEPSGQCTTYPKEPLIATYSEERPSRIGNGHWNIPFLSDEMFDSHLIYDSGEQDCKTEWTEKGMRFWCESGMFDVEFGDKN